MNDALETELRRLPEPSRPASLSAAIMARTRHVDDRRAAATSVVQPATVRSRRDHLAWAAVIAGIAIGLGMQVFTYATAGFRVDSTAQWIRVGPTALLDSGHLGPGVLALATGLTLYLVGLFASVDSVRR
jgi:hypothetical protein